MSYEDVIDDMKRKRQPPLRAHEHFCSRCYPFKRTNGSARGWWRCTAKLCTKPMKAECRDCTAKAEATPDQRVRRGK